MCISASTSFQREIRCGTKLIHSGRATRRESRNAGPFLRAPSTHFRRKFDDFACWLIEQRYHISISPSSFSFSLFLFLLPSLSFCLFLLSLSNLLRSNWFLFYISGFHLSWANDPARRYILLYILSIIRDPFRALMCRSDFRETSIRRRRRTHFHRFCVIMSVGGE